MFTVVCCRQPKMAAAMLRTVCLLPLLLASIAAWAAKTDVVLLKNGDRVTGEVKRLGQNKLEFSTDYMGTVHIEWEDIQEIYSNTGQAVELTNGQRFYGPLAKSENQDMMVVRTAEGEVGLNTLDVITMYPVEASFWERLDLTADLGFAWDKGSSVGKYNIGLGAEFRDPRFVTRASLTSEVTTQEGRDDSSRATADAEHLVFRQDKRYHGFFGNLESNDELGIDMRVVLGAANGAMPIRSLRNRLGFAAGLAVNHEIPVGAASETNLEAFGSVAYSYFKYSDPERSLNSNLRIFPSITDAGRWRATFATDFRLELVADLFWKLYVYASYDSDPISTEGEGSDYGINSSLAYKF